MINDEAITCTDCSFSNKAQDNYCKMCGKKLANRVRPKIPFKFSRNHIVLLGALGIILIGYSILKLIDVETIDIPPISIHIAGIILFLTLVGIGLVLRKRSVINTDAVILLFITAEVIFLATQFIYDILARSTYSRYTLLVSATLVVLFSLSTRPFFDLSTLQSIHLLMGFYFGWAVIYLIAV